MRRLCEAQTLLELAETQSPHNLADQLGRQLRNVDRQIIRLAVTGSYDDAYWDSYGQTRLERHVLVTILNDWWRWLKALTSACQPDMVQAAQELPIGDKTIVPRTLRAGELAVPYRSYWMAAS